MCRHSGAPVRQSVAARAELRSAGQLGSSNDNRLSEEIKAPNDTLKRATRRIFDQLGRLQSVVVQ